MRALTHLHTDQQVLKFLTSIFWCELLAHTQGCRVLGPLLRLPMAHAQLEHCLASGLFPRVLNLASIFHLIFSAPTDVPD